MAGRLVQLAADAGINRLRVKGGPPKGALYDLLNGYVDATGAVVSRPGTTTHRTLPSGTVSMAAFDGALVVFSHEPVDGLPDGVTCEVLTHPTDPTAALARIHFAGPFLGYLYVCAEFADERVCDYWLQQQGAWEPETRYELGALVEPTVRNGYAYRATRAGDPNPLWTANTPRAVGDKVEPTTADGFFYEVTDTLGDSPRSGATEPDWNDENGALTYEDVDTGAVTTPSTGPVTAPTTPGTNITDRYRNPSGPGSRRTQ